MLRNLVKLQSHHRELWLVNKAVSQKVFTRIWQPILLLSGSNKLHCFIKVVNSTELLDVLNNVHQFLSEIEYRKTSVRGFLENCKTESSCGNFGTQFALSIVFIKKKTLKWMCQFEILTTFRKRLNPLDYLK